MLTSESLLWRVYSRVYPTVTRSYPYREMMRAVAGEVPAGARLVDLGCGTGALLDYIAAPSRYLGIDRQPAMLNAARARAVHQHSTTDAAWRDATLEFEQGSIYEPIDWGLPDHVVINNAFYVLPQKRRALAIVFQQLAPGGRLVLCDPIGRPSIYPVLREHFARYRAEHGRAALLRHRLDVLWRLVLITVINRRILDEYRFLTPAELETKLHSVGFAIERSRTTYAGQNKLIVARKPPQQNAGEGTEAKEIP